MRALITGAGGQLGSDLRDLLGDDAVTRGHAELDITDVAQVERTLEEVQPDVVFNCAAFHNVDECERSPQPAWDTNVRAVMELAKRGPKLVHLSTNYVFDGRREEPYGEDDLPSPRSVYALTKLAGEYAAVGYGDGALVVRSSGLYGFAGNASKGGNFVQRMLGRARDPGPPAPALKMVSDQRLQPTFTYDLARGLVEAVGAGESGVLHLTNSGACSWLEFTQAIIENAGVEVPIEAVETTIPPGGVDRPLNGVLSSRLGEPLRPWREALDDYMARAGLAAVA